MSVKVSIQTIIASRCLVSKYTFIHTVLKDLAKMLKSKL